MSKRPLTPSAMAKRRWSKRTPEQRRREMRLLAIQRAASAGWKLKPASRRIAIRHGWIAA